MKVDKTTYNDKEENQNGMTADHTSRPDKVLFFADLHFLFLKFITQMAHCLFACQTSQNFAKAKEPFFPPHKKSRFTNSKL